MWYWILLILGIVYVGIALVFYFFQHFFFFRPERLPTGFQYRFPFPFQELTFAMEDGGSINCIYFKVPNSRGVVYYLKGNSRSIKGWGKFAKDFVSNGYDFLMMDYRGFGKSKGKRTEHTLYSDAQYMYKWLSERYAEEDIVLYGRSLGSGIAARIASWNHPRLLILDSPYYSFYHNIKRYLFLFPVQLLLRYQIRTDQFVRVVSCPIYLLHGTHDRLFPLWHSQRLQALAPDRITLLPIEQAGHNNLPDYPQFYQLLYDLLDQSAKQSDLPLKLAVS